MHYTQLFRSLREAKGLTLEGLATLARRHRNTVVNVESGRPVKFKTIAELMVKMGYPAHSPEMKSVALLWLEAVSGIPFSQPEATATASKTIATYRATARDSTRRLQDVVTRAGLSSREIELLLFAAQHPEALAILDSVRSLTAELAASHEKPTLKVAEEP